MKIFAENYRGFSFVEIDLSKINFLVGDNSSGKSSLIYLIEAISKNDLHDVPRFDENFGIGEYDYFSPYFNYDNVSFGYSDKNGENAFIKIITVKKGTHGYPHFLKCSYYYNSKFMSFKQKGNSLQCKTIENISIDDNKDALMLHHQERGYKTVDGMDGVSLGNPSLIISSLDYKSLGLDPLARAAFTTALDSYRLVSPTRALPEKFYKFGRKFNAHGLHFATMWMDFSDMEKEGAFANVNKFGKDSNLFESIKVRKISNKIDDSPLIVSVFKSNKEFLLNQVGVGVSQVVPVLMETVFALQREDTSVLCQQPELHLHPIAQAALGSYFYSASEAGLRGVLETHSSFLIDRFRADLRDSYKKQDFADRKIHAEDVSILFCQNGLQGNFVHDIGISRDGKLLNDPEVYHQFFVDEYMRTML